MYPVIITFVQNLHSVIILSPVAITYILSSIPTSCHRLHPVIAYILSSPTSCHPHLCLVVVTYILSSFPFYHHHLQPVITTCILLSSPAACCHHLCSLIDTCVLLLSSISCYHHLLRLHSHLHPLHLCPVLTYILSSSSTSSMSSTPISCHLHWDLYQHQHPVFQDNFCPVIPPTSWCHPFRPVVVTYDLLQSPVSRHQHIHPVIIIYVLYDQETVRTFHRFSFFTVSKTFCPLFLAVN